MSKVPGVMEVARKISKVAADFLQREDTPWGNVVPRDYQYIHKYIVEKLRVVEGVYALIIHRISSDLFLKCDRPWSSTTGLLNRLSKRV